MKRKRRVKFVNWAIVFPILAAIIAILGPRFILARTSDSYEIKDAQEAIDSAGTKRESTNYRIADSGGQFAVGDSSNNYLESTSYRLYAGYINTAYHPPTGTVTVDTNLIYEGGLVQVVTITYNKTMAATPAPTITFTGAIGAITTQNDGSWDGTSKIWTETFSVADENEETAVVTVSSSLAEDIDDNVEGTCVSGTFEIDTNAPAIAESAISILAGVTAKIGTTVDIAVASCPGDLSTIVFTSAASGDVLYDLDSAVDVAFNDSVTAPDAVASDNIWSGRFTVLDSGSTSGSADDATYGIEVTLTDVAGNSQTIISTSNTLNVDNIAPTGYTLTHSDDESTSPDDGFPPLTGFDDDTTIKFSVGSAPTDAAFYQYRLDSPGGAYDSWITSATKEYTSTEGSHTVYVKVKDDAGNVGSEEPSASVTIDTTAPATATVSAPVSAGYSVSAAIPSVFQGDVGDNSGGSGAGENRSVFYLRKVSGSVSYYWDGTDWDATTEQWLAAIHDNAIGNNASLWSDNIALPTWVDKETYFVRVKSVDKAGNIYRGAESSFYYDTTIPDGIDTVSGYVDTEVASILADTTSMKADITSILTDTVAMEPKVTSILEDTADIQPKVTSIVADTTAILVDTADMQPKIVTILESTGTTIPVALTTMERKIRARIINREASVKTGETVMIRYRTDNTIGLSPDINVYDANNARQVTSGTMTEVDDTGVYEYDVAFLSAWGQGDFTIVCSESTQSTVDSMTISVLSTDLETVAADVSATLADTASLETKVTTARAGYLDKLNFTGNFETDIIDKIADGESGLAALKNLLNAIDTSTELAAKFTEIKGAGWFDENLTSIQSFITGIKAETDKITSNVLANIATVDGKVVTVDTVVDAIKLKTDTIVWANVTDIKAETDKITSGVLADLGLVKGYTVNLAANIATVDGKVVTVDSVVDAIKLETDKITLNVLADTAAIKAETDKITSNVLANIATVDGKVVTVDTVVDAIKLKTDTIVWANVTDIKAETDKITSGVLADLGLVKGYTVNLAANIATVDGKVVTVDSVVDAIKLETDKITLNVLADTAAIKAETDKITSNVLANIATVDGKVVTVDTVVDAIKLKTDTIVWANVTDIKAETDKITSGVLADLGLVKGYTVNLAANIATVDGKVVTVDSVVDAIKLETDKITLNVLADTAAIKAETDKITSNVLANIATVDGKVVTVDTVVDAIKLKTDTIVWANVTDIKAETDKITSGVLADLGLVKGYTDLVEANILDLDGDVVNVKTVADAIQAKTDTIVWANVTAIMADADAVETRLTEPRASYLDQIADTTYGLEAIKTLVDDIETSAGLTAKFTEIKGAGWTDETMVSIKNYVDDLETRLTAARAVYLDKLNITGNFQTDVIDKVANATYGLSALKTLVDAIDTSTELSAKFTEIKGTGWAGETLKSVKEYVDTLEIRLTETRAGYLDKLAHTAYGLEAVKDLVDAVDTSTELAARFDEIKGSDWTDETITGIKEYVDSLETRLTATRAGYLDKLGITGDLQLDVIDKLEGLGDMGRMSSIDVSGLSSLGETVIAISGAVTSVMTDINRIAAMSDRLKGLKVTAVSIESISDRVSILAERLDEISKIQGVKIEKMYDTSEEQSNDVDYLKNKTIEIKGLVELTQEILSRTGDEPIVKSWLESAPKE